MFRKNSGPYSLRSSSSSGFFLDCFFIEFSFARSYRSGADQPDEVSALGKGYKRSSAGVGSPDDDLAPFANRVIGIFANRSDIIIEHGHRLLKTHAVLREIRIRFVVVPIEADRPHHPRNYHEHQCATGEAAFTAHATDDAAAATDDTGVQVVLMRKRTGMGACLH